MLTRRAFGRLALAGVPGAALAGRGAIVGAFAQARPNSLIEGVQIGTITSSFRSMRDQSAEATLKYLVESGISAVELMGAPVEAFAGAPGTARTGAAGSGTTTASGGGVAAWLGEPCETPGAAAKPAAAAPGAGARGPARTAADRQSARREQASALKAWRSSVSMDAFRKLRRMYNDAGVTIYAWKQLSPAMSDEEMEYVFDVAAALGCTHTTLELPTSRAQLKRIGDFAMTKKIHAGYHTHLPASMTAFDRAFAASPGNMANVDLAYWAAAGSVGGTAIRFLQKHHDRIASVHLKDRTTAKGCALNQPWGKGDTPIREILQLLKKSGWRMPATIELEYAIPPGSDAVKEVRTCLEYCRSALMART